METNSKVSDENQAGATGPYPVNMATSRPFTVSKFASVYAKDPPSVASWFLEDIAELVEATTAPTKDQLPLIKLGEFSGKPNKTGCYRYDQAVLSLAGAFGDYDEGKVPMDVAADAMEAVGILAEFYETPSATADVHRWRVVVPFSQDVTPAEHATLVSKLNYMLHDRCGAELAVELWTLSTCYFIGNFDGTPQRRCRQIKGVYIDLMEGLGERLPVVAGVEMTFKDGKLGTPPEMWRAIAKMVGQLGGRPAHPDDEYDDGQAAP